MKDPQLKELLRDLVETYNKKEEYNSIYSEISPETIEKVDALVAYVKVTY